MFALLINAPCTGTHTDFQGLKNYGKIEELRLFMKRTMSLLQAANFQIHLDYFGLQKYFIY